MKKMYQRPTFSVMEITEDVIMRSGDNFGTFGDWY